MPVKTASTLAAGLPSDSRTMLELSGNRYPASVFLQAAALDRLSMLVWMQSKDAVNGKNKPKMMIDVLNSEGKTDNVRGFASGEDFEKARENLIRGVK